MSFVLTGQHLLPFSAGLRGLRLGGGEQLCEGVRGTGRQYCQDRDQHRPDSGAGGAVRGVREVQEK